MAGGQVKTTKQVLGILKISNQTLYLAIKAAGIRPAQERVPGKAVMRNLFSDLQIAQLRGIISK